MTVAAIEDVAALLAEARDVVGALQRAIAKNGFADLEPRVGQAFIPGTLKKFRVFRDLAAHVPLTARPAALGGWETRQ